MRRLCILVIALALMTPLAAQAEQDGLEFIDGNTLVLGGTRMTLFDARAPGADEECTEIRAGGPASYPCGSYAMVMLMSLVGTSQLYCVDGDGAEETDRTCFADGHDLAESMVRRGWAVQCGATSRYVRAEAEARAARRGLWGGTFDIAGRCPE